MTPTETVPRRPALRRGLLSLLCSLAVVSGCGGSRASWDADQCSLTPTLHWNVRDVVRIIEGGAYSRCRVQLDTIDGSRLRLELLPGPGGSWDSPEPGALRLELLDVDSDLMYSQASALYTHTDGVLYRAGLGFPGHVTILGAGGGNGHHLDFNVSRGENARGMLDVIAGLDIKVSLPSGMWILQEGDVKVVADSDATWTPPLDFSVGGSLD